MARFTRGEPSLKKIKATPRQMLSNAAKTAAETVRSGLVSAEIHAQRLVTCQTCPAFIVESKRCSECGCFMEAKAWSAAEPKFLCPLNKWLR